MGVAAYKRVNRKGIWYVAASDGIKLKTFAFSRLSNLTLQGTERVNDFATPGDVNLVCGRRVHWWESSPQVAG